MTTSPRCWRPFAILSVCALAWILILSLALRYLLGAAVSGGWLIVGILFSAVAVGVVVLIKEFTDAILLPENFDLREGRCRPECPAGKMAGSEQDALDRSFAELRRATLGLNSRSSRANRRRSARRSHGEPLTGGLAGHGA